MAQEPSWLIEARKHLGLSEVKGAAHNAEILKMWRDIKRGGIKDDETPWCAAFVGSMLERVGVRSTRFESAKSYLQWGILLPEPALGCVVVFSRDGGGHVGFLVGYDDKGNLLVLGGNQGDKVSIRSFPVKRVTGYRYPDGLVLPLLPVPVVKSVAASTSES
jgi:uncharacterized protein (TIGR02594 family)